GCAVRYRRQGDEAWKDGLARWYDARNRECRGSLVQLAPGTACQVQFAYANQAPVAELTATTWSNAFPIAKTIYVSSSNQTLNVTEGGSPAGYVLYTPAPGTTATIDVQNAQPYGANIN